MSNTIIDIDPTSPESVCPKCCSVMVVQLSLWEAAEKGAVNFSSTISNAKDVNFYQCNSCQTIWREI